MRIAYRSATRSTLRRAMQYRIANKTMHSITQRGLIPEVLWKRLPVDFEFSVVINKEASFTYASDEYDKVGRGLFWRGLRGYEPEVIEVFLTLARQAETILDLGANTGLYTLLACAINNAVEVIAVEPVPRVFSRLQRNLELNNWMSRCVLINRAVSNKDGEATLYIPYTREDRISVMAYAASLYDDWQHPNKAREQIQVEVSTIDHLCPPNKAIHLVKMDVEGVEDKVIEGMQRVISSFSPSIIFECRPDGPQKDIEEMLRDYGYHFWHLVPNGPQMIKQIPEPEAAAPYWNYLATIDSN